MKNLTRTTVFSNLANPLWMQTVSILFCLTAVVPINTQAQQAEPSERLTMVFEPAGSTVYSFNYPTVNTVGEPIVLSSALVAWTPNDRVETDSIESVHIYSHATIGSDEERPSSEGFSKEQIMLQLMSGRTYKNLFADNSADYVARCIIIAPDYEGYGVTKDLPHPYLSQQLTAQQVLDAVNYGLKLYRKTAEKTEDNLLPSRATGAHLASVSLRGARSHWHYNDSSRKRGWPSSYTSAVASVATVHTTL